MEKRIYLDKNNNVICWGDVYGCNNYIKQLYSYPIESLYYEEYSPESKYSYFYEDYEVVQVRGVNIFLTLGQVKMMKKLCAEEIRGITLVKKELDMLSRMDNVFDDDMLENLVNMEKYMDEVYRVYTQYNTNNLFENLDMDALHSMYQTERENKGLPVVYIK